MATFMGSMRRSREHLVDGADHAAVDLDAHAEVVQGCKTRPLEVLVLVFMPLAIQSPRVPSMVLDVAVSRSC